MTEIANKTIKEYVFEDLPSLNLDLEWLEDENNPEIFAVYNKDESIIINMKIILQDYSPLCTTWFLADVVLESIKKKFSKKLAFEYFYNENG